MNVAKKESTVIELVHCYFYFFHAWVAESRLGIIFLRITFLTLWFTLIECVVLLMMYYISEINESLKTLIQDNSQNIIIVFLFSLSINLIFTFISFMLFSPFLSTKRIINRLNSNLMLDLKFEDFGKKNKALHRYELESIWIKHYLKGVCLRETINNIEKNISSRRPKSRDLVSIVSKTFNNPYVINFLVILLTVILTIVSNPLFKTINDDNFFKALGLFILEGITLWCLIVAFIFIVKLLLNFLSASFEFTANMKLFILWRY